MMGKKIIDQFAVTFKSPLFLQFAPPTLTIKTKLLLLAGFIALLQLLLRIGCLGEYGFHQDELLYLALSDHLAWGYREVPPFIAAIGATSKLLFGDSVAAARIIPSICAALVVLLTGMLTIRLGGKFFAVTLACITIAFSPAFLAAGALFIPQVFDELCWVLSAYLLVAYLQDRHQRYLLFFGLVAGVGMLVKYTFIIYLLGLLLGIFMQPKHRHIFKAKIFWLGMFAAILIFLPHLWWQYEHNFPALNHYSELQVTQLVYLSRLDFVIQQLVVNGTGIVIWVAGILLLAQRKLSQYRFLGVSFFVVMITICALNGKSYYAFGCFPPLFALGAIFFEKRLRLAAPLVKSAFLTTLSVPNLLLAIVVLPYLPIEKAAKVFEWTYINLGIHYPLKWEDQKIHNMNQNYADMIGWDELAQKTAKLYRSLPAESKQHTLILAEKYGEAGAIDQYREDYALPPVISLCSSYALWAPPQLEAKNIIYIGITPLPSFIKAQQVETVDNPYARVSGMRMYLIKNVDTKIRAWYKQQWKNQHQLKNPLAKLWRKNSTS